MSPPQNDGLCHKCGQPGHRAVNYHSVQSHNAQCPPVARKKRSQNRRFRDYKDMPYAISCARFTHVKMEEARESPRMVMGTLLVNSVPATVLFDSGASYSFMSQPFAQLHGLAMEPMATPLAVNAVGS